MVADPSGLTRYVHHLLGRLQDSTYHSQSPITYQPLLFRPSKLTSWVLSSPLLVFANFHIRRKRPSTTSSWGQPVLPSSTFKHENLRPYPKITISHDGIVLHVKDLLPSRPSCLSTYVCGST